MDAIKRKFKELFKKYKYALIVFLVGIGLLLMPGKSKTETKQEMTVEQTVCQNNLSEELETILSKIDGAGRVEVVLTESKGQQTYYQYDSDNIVNDNSSNSNITTVILSDSSKNEHGMITRVDPAQYQGAVVLCQGAESSAIRLAIIDAVSKVTGLGADKICVLKMK